MSVTIWLKSTFPTGLLGTESRDKASLLYIQSAGLISRKIYKFTSHLRKNSFFQIFANINSMHHNYTRF